MRRGLRIISAVECSPVLPVIWEGKMIWNIRGLIFTLCPIHRKCAQDCFDMKPPKCNIKRCLAQTTRTANEAYWKTINQE